MRILNVVADGRPGGGTTVVLGLCADLLEEGSGVWEPIVLTESQSYAAGAARKLGLPVRECSFFGSTYPWQALIGVKKALAELRPDVVHVHGCRAALPLAMISRLIPVPLSVYTVHGYHFAHHSGIRKVLGRWAECFSSRSVEATVFVSDGDRAVAQHHRLLGCASTPHHTVHNGIDIDAIDAVCEERQKEFDLVFAARLVHQKNPILAIQAFSRLLKTDSRMLVVGGGDLEDACRAEAARLGVGHRITFTGALDHGSTLQAIASARVFLMTSRWEGLPVTPMEASHLGVPTVGVRVAGLDEVIVDESTGILVEEAEPGLLARAVDRLLADPTLLQHYSSRSRSHVGASFSRRRCSQSYMDIYRSLVHRNSISLA